MIKRKLNFQEDLQIKLDESFYVSRNVYPITSLCYVEDKETGTRLVIISDRA